MTIPPDTIIADPSTTDAVEDLVFECELEAAPPKVWRALTVPAYVAAWLMPGYVDAHTGTGFSFEGEVSGLTGRVDCEVLASEPPHRLRYAWREHHPERTVASVVTFELDPTKDGGTHLRIVHGDFVSTPVAANANEPTMLLRAA